MPDVLVFDVNETLLDLAALDPVFERLFGDPAVRPLWFAQMLQLALVSTVTGRYADFGACALAALAATADVRGVTLRDADRDAVVRGMRELPAHPEVPAALDRLRDAGYRLATLTNSTQPVADAQLAYAGLTDRFERRLSADAVRRLKPAAEPYRMAADTLGVEVGALWLVAAHAWDIAGASAAGCRTAFVARPGKPLDPLTPAPDIKAADLTGIAEALLARRAG